MNINTKQNYINQPEKAYHLDKILSRATEGERDTTPPVGIVSQGLQIIQEYNNLLGELHRDEMDKSEEFVDLIHKVTVLGEKLNLLKEYRIDTRNVRKENNQIFEQNMQMYKKTYQQTQDLVYKRLMLMKNIQVTGLDEEDIYIQNLIQDYIEGYIDITQLYGDSRESSFDVVPKYGLSLENIRYPLTGLNDLWRYPVRTAQTQLIINHCIHLIVGIGNILKHAIPTPEQRKQIYEKKGKKANWCDDYLLHICGELQDGVKQSPPYRLPYTSAIIQQILCLDKFEKFQSWEKLQVEIYNSYPVLTQSFENPLDYFSSTYYSGIFHGLMFANVPDTAKYHQMLKIREQVKELKEILDQIEGIGEGDRLKVITYAQIWSIINNCQGGIYDNCFKQKLEDKQYNNNSLILANSLFKQLCKKLSEMSSHPFELLENLFHQAREKRAKILGLGHQIGEMACISSITSYPVKYNI